MKFYTSDQIELDYDDFGAKSDPVVMILSGIGAYKEYWKKTIAALVENHYRVINIDARNQGKSEHTNQGLRISRHAMDLYELQQKLEITDSILMEIQWEPRRFRLCFLIWLILITWDY